MRRDLEKYKEEQERLKKLYITPRTKETIGYVKGHCLNKKNKLTGTYGSYIGATECYHCPMWYHGGEKECPRCGADNSTHKKKWNGRYKDHNG